MIKKIRQYRAETHIYKKHHKKLKEELRIPKQRHDDIRFVDINYPWKMARIK